MPRNTLALSPTITLAQRLEARAALKASIAAAEAEVKAMDAAIQAELHERGVESLIEGDTKVQIIVVDGRTSLDKAKLVELGVPTDILKQAETQGKPYTRLDVRKVKA